MAKSNTSVLERRLAARDNYFNRVRLGLALLVLLDHAWAVSLGAGAEIFKVFDLTAGYIAVNGFFVLSGLLIARSLSRKGAGLDYWLARALRVYPALAVLALIATFVIGPIVAAGVYFNGAETLSYGWNVLHFGATDGGPNGFYPGNPLPGEFSAPLWTLRYEVLCYIFAPALLLFGMLRNRWIMLAGTIALGLCVVVIQPYAPAFDLPDILESSARFGFAFVLGMTVWAWREYVRFDWRVLTASAALFILAGLVDVGLDVAATLLIGTVVLWLGLLPRKGGAPKSDTDLSYGVYIWHFPAMQVLQGEMAWLGPWGILVGGAIAALIIAYASWHLVERLALHLKGRLRPRIAA